MLCKGILDPAKLPPTERAAYYHGLRVHLQVSPNFIYYSQGTKALYCHNICVHNLFEFLPFRSDY